MIAIAKKVRSLKQISQAKEMDEDEMKRLKKHSSTLTKLRKVLKKKANLGKDQIDLKKL